MPADVAGTYVEDISRRPTQPAECQRKPQRVEGTIRERREVAHIPFHRADGKSLPLGHFPVPVQLGVSDGDEVQVSGNLRPGQKIVVRGNERLMPGEPVVVADEPRQAKPPSVPVPPSGPTSASSPAKTR